MATRLQTSVKLDEPSSGSLYKGIALAIDLALEASKDGRTADMVRYLELARKWCDVAPQELKASMERVTCLKPTPVAPREFREQLCEVGEAVQ